MRGFPFFIILSILICHPLFISWHRTWPGSQLMTNREISGQLQGSWLTFQTLPVYYLRCQSSTCHRLTSTLIPRPASVRQPRRQRASWTSEGWESRIRRLCCDPKCVWNYVNSAYPVLIAFAARMSILNVKETIYCFQSLPGPPWIRPAPFVGVASAICCLCHLPVSYLIHFNNLKVKPKLYCHEPECFFIYVGSLFLV